MTFLGRTKTDVCTEIDFDFDRREWSDGKFFEDSHFMKKWENKFDGVWYKQERMWPPHPSLPQFVLLGTDSHEGVSEVRALLGVPYQDFNFGGRQKLPELPGQLSLLLNQESFNTVP